MFSEYPLAPTLSNPTSPAQAAAPPASPTPASPATTTPSDTPQLTPPPRPVTPPTPLPTLPNPLPWLVALWALGVAALSLRLLAHTLYSLRLKHRTRPSPPRWQKRLRTLEQRLGLRRPVALLISPHCDTPSVVGLLRPVILIPVSALCGLTPAQLTAILAHELAHIRRYDPLVNLLQSVIETLLFYHPAIHWLGAQMRLERECCCDDLAVTLCQDPRLYAHALTALETQRHTQPSLALSSQGGDLMTRIRHILGLPTRPAKPLPLVAAVLLPLLFASTLFIVLYATANHATANQATANYATGGEIRPRLYGPLSQVLSCPTRTTPRLSSIRKGLRFCLKSGPTPSVRFALPALTTLASTTIASTEQQFPSTARPKRGLRRRYVKGCSSLCSTVSADTRSLAEGDASPDYGGCSKTKRCFTPYLDC